MKKLLTSCFGLGHLPVAPGTWGSIPPVLVFAGLCLCGASWAVTSAAMFIIAIGASISCVLFAPEVIGLTGKKDPSQVVADEVAGQALTFITAYAVAPKNILIVSLIGFAAFRFFDILKPYPCKKLEKLPSGWGILADDLMAGVYAGIVLQICIHLAVL
jgi:phosphatidylglycerophosphatase A